MQSEMLRREICLGTPHSRAHGKNGRKEKEASRWKAKGLEDNLWNGTQEIVGDTMPNRQASISADIGNSEP